MGRGARSSAVLEGGLEPLSILRERASEVTAMRVAGQTCQTGIAADLGAVGCRGCHGPPDLVSTDAMVVHITTPLSTIAIDNLVLLSACVVTCCA